jgi:hypothetical protein
MGGVSISLTALKNYLSISLTMEKKSNKVERRLSASTGHSAACERLLAPLASGPHASKMLQRMSEPGPTTKVLFRVEFDDGSAEVETLWAYDLGGDVFRLDNSPFYAYGVSWKDVVHAPYDEYEGRATFKRVITKSGHRTVRVNFDPPWHPGGPADSLLLQLKAMGCSWEGDACVRFSIDIPPTLDLKTVRALLIECHADWEHADPTYEQLFPNG